MSFVEEYYGRDSIPPQPFGSNYVRGKIYGSSFPAAESGLQDDWPSNDGTPDIVGIDPALLQGDNCKGNYKESFPQDGNLVATLSKL